jgi:antitoxin (DNA-binding transcriptional repressor) of toxin-antitoxin stability system
MKTVTLEEAREHLGELCDEARVGKHVLLARGEELYALVPFDPPLEPSWDDPNLEAAILKAVDGPHQEMSPDELRQRGERLIAEFKAGKK